MRYPIRKFTHKTRAVVLRRALSILERNEVTVSNRIPIMRIFT